MSIGEICNRQVTVTYRHVVLSEAARTMRETHVGCLIVVDESGNRRIPVGIITDRDIAVKVVAMDLDARTLSVGEAMTSEPVVARVHDSELETLRLMRRHGVRRVPVVDGTGGLIGIVTIDDVLSRVAEELGELAVAIRTEQDWEGRKV